MQNLKSSIGVFVSKNWAVLRMRRCKWQGLDLVVHGATSSINAGQEFWAMPGGGIRSTKELMATAPVHIYKIVEASMAKRIRL